MTSFDRLERAIPDLMTELAPARAPDYFDDMLQQTAHTPQRPAWSVPERWLPMSVITRTQPMRPLPWRAITILATLAILIALVATALFAGSQPRLPTPFGLARNGTIVFSTPEGDIVRADPETGTTATLIAGPALDSNPWFSNDGTRFAFDRRTPGSAAALYVANADGTELRQLSEPAPEIAWFDWSPTGDRFALGRVGDPFGQVTIMDTSDGSTTEIQLELELEIVSAVWRPDGDQLVIATQNMPGGSADQGMYVVRSDGTDLRPIATGPAVINTPTVSPDGSKLAYSTWETGGEGRTHIVDIDSGVEAGVDYAPDFEYTDLSPIFSPDGESFVVQRYSVDGYRLTMLSMDGKRPPVPMGAAHPEMTDGATVIFSPDGTKVLATYKDDRTTWLLDVATGDAEQMTWSIPTSTSATWQRLAP